MKRKDEARAGQRPRVGQHRAAAGIDEALDGARLVPPQDPHHGIALGRQARRRRSATSPPPRPRTAGAAPRARTASPPPEAGSSAPSSGRSRGRTPRACPSRRSRTAARPARRRTRCAASSSRRGSPAPCQPPLARRTRPKAATPGNDPDGDEDETEAEPGAARRIPRSAGRDRPGRPASRPGRRLRCAASPSSPAGRARPGRPGRPRRHSRRRWPRPDAQ